MRRLGALSVALAFALAACGTTVPASERAAARAAARGEGIGAPSVPDAGTATTQLIDGGGGGATSVTQRGSTATSPRTATTTIKSGAAQDTRPIKVGMLGIAPVGGAASSAGITAPQNVSPSQGLQAVADSYRKAGGIAGRPLTTVLAELDASGDFQAQLNAACASFTQDNRVDVVISADASNDAILAQCLNKAGIPRISVAYGAGNAAAFRSFPLSRHVGAPNADRRANMLVTRSVASAMLTPQSRVGVVVEDCPINRAVLEDTLRPALQRANVATVAVHFAKCIQAFSDAGTASAQMGNAVLKFSSERVDRVMFVSNFEATLLLFFTQIANQQAFRPGYLLTSLANVPSVQKNFPASQIANMRGWGWIPSADDSNGNRAVTESQRACIARVVSAGRNPQTALDYQASLYACDGFSALEKALVNSRGDSRATNLLAGLDAASSALNLAAVVDGRVQLTNERHDGPTRVRQFGYQAACGCFSYTGPPQDMG